MYELKMVRYSAKIQQKKQEYDKYILTNKIKTNQRVTAFFIFLDELHNSSLKQDHHEANGVAVVGKAEGKKDVSEFEKARYIEKSQHNKQKYDQFILQHPNQPTRPSKQFFIFLDEFNNLFMEDHTEAKNIAVIGKG